MLFCLKSKLFHLLMENYFLVKMCGGGDFNIFEDLF